MSTPESIVVSLEKARELKAAGWSNRSTFVFVHYNADVKLRMRKEAYPCEIDPRGGDEHGIMAWDAPTSEEILRRLPKVIDRELLLQINTFGDDWNVGYWNVNEHTQIKYQQFADTLADAAADMFCHLSKNNLLPKA